ncbi:putative multi antimicrobial extrusion protein [Helianthus annuus]|uniref:Protein DETOXIFICATION n=1 Tax=Helianthus annuus TaxID=4232 RepID=A0A251U2C3_HELAN|nr:protein DETOXIFICATION 16 [Helianthus annuus]KAF5794032.1 putative multi antimicrobial extrusion protein [Helianthus annuus]KAJ0552342.1 putative multi antimicrobial extrusion protein [Helianthus annuus]KAJ0718043.1 putative multi antimicrobial extrusion protein [Helianthus annuus]KAJ0896442.1 putative multi antimicrobial extrusion protein [Helianthus annuus]
MIKEQAKAVQDPLIQRQYDDQNLTEHEDEDEDGDLRTQVIVEVKKQIGLAGPLIAVSLLQYCLEVISIMFAGHLGQLPLSSASMATSFASFTGFSVLLGMGSALETLCGQAYGAKQYHMLGIQMQRAMITLTALCIPLAIIWFYTTTIFIALGQDEEISIGAGNFIRWMIPCLFAYALLQCLNRFLQTQNIVVPMMTMSGVTALLHIFICWALVYKLGLGIKGAALANTISNWINVVLLGVYVKLSPTCKHTWTGFSKEAMNDLLSFLKLAVPSAVMICFEYWSFDMVVLLSGLLPNPKLETSVLSISLNTCWMVYMISVGLGGAISTRVSNELGAARPEAARLAVIVVVVIAILEGLVVGSITILVRRVWGRLYSDDEEVINYVATMMPLLALSDFLDGFQCVLSGAARGCGWQNICAVINLGAYYIVGIPCALLFAFVLHVGGMGLWMGVICALSIQVVALIAINLSTNWTDEAWKAICRVQTSNAIE